MDTDLAQMLNNLVHRGRVGEQAEQLLKLSPIPDSNTIMATILHEFPIEPKGHDYWFCAG